MFKTLSIRRWILLAVGISLIGLIFGIVIAWKPLSEVLVSNALSRVRNKNLQFSYDKLDTSLPKADLSGLEMWFKPAMVSLLFDHLSLSLSPLSLLTLSPKFTIDGQLYSGTARGDLQASKSSLSSKIDIAGINLAQHTQLSGLGITKGILALKIEDLEMEGDELKRILGDISIADLSIPQLPIPKDTLPIALPPLDGLNATFKVDLKDGQGTINLSELRCNLGSATGLVTVEQPDASKKMFFKGDFKVNLSETSLVFIGPFIPVISEGRLEKGASSFTASIKGVPCVNAPKRSLALKVGAWCIDGRIS